MTDVWNISGKTHERLCLLPDVPQDLSNRVPQRHCLFRLSWLQKFLQRHRFLLGTVVKDEIFYDERLNDGLKATRCIFRAAKAERMLG